MERADSTSLVTKLHALEARIAELEIKPKIAQLEDDLTHNGEEDIDVIVDYGSRRERLRKAYDWEMERLSLREEEDLRRRDRARKALKSSSVMGEPGKMPVTLREHRDPVMRSVEWTEFKHLNRFQDTSLCAVDILIGEPEVYDNMGFTGSWLGLSERHARTKATQKKPDKQFPERIRIHSDLLAVLLDKIMNSAGNERVGSDCRPVVFTRPFKALTYCEAGLQHWCKLLKGDDSTNSGNHKGNPQNNIWAKALCQIGQSEDMDDTSSDDETSDADADLRTKSWRTLSGFPKAFEEVNFFVNVLQSEVLQRREYLHSGNCQQVFFSDLWHLFRPGTEVIRVDGKQAYRVLHVTSSRHRMLSALQRWAGPPRATGEEKETRPELRVTCVNIDFDGTRLGPVVQVFDFKPFEGEKDVRSLAVFPIRLYSVLRTRSRNNELGGKAEGGLGSLTEAAWYRQKLVSRGIGFLKALENQRMRYAGPTIDLQDEVEGEVIVDFEAAFASDTGSRLQQEKPKVATLSSLATDDYASDQDCQFGCCAKDYVYDDTNIDQFQSVDYVNSLLPGRGSGKPSPVVLVPQTLSELKANAESGCELLQDSELLILSHRVFAFVLRNRKWAQLDVDFLSDIQNDTAKSRLQKHQKDAHDKTAMGESVIDSSPVPALHRLVLPKGHKELMVSLISQHIRSKEVRGDPTNKFDVIQGKGKGLTFMLHGPPGVGKTSSAEGVADLFEKPLFQVTCGDLGLNSRDLEKALETIFNLATRWDCILLLDEAEVFLAKRTSHDFQQNGLVAVFLRVLEYYPGILFLTSNRVGAFDEAFMSRIHVALYYPVLTLRQTLRILVSNLSLIEERFSKCSGVIDIDRRGIIDYVKGLFERGAASWNGRQVRNACQTALALAEFEAQGGDYRTARDGGISVDLSPRHFEVVGDAYNDFENYLSDLYRMNTAKRALMSYNRDDHWRTEGRKVANNIDESDADSDLSSTSAITEQSDVQYTTTADRSLDIAHGWSSSGRSKTPQLRSPQGMLPTTNIPSVQHTQNSDQPTTPNFPSASYLDVHSRTQVPALLEPSSMSLGSSSQHHTDRQVAPWGHAKTDVRVRQSGSRIPRLVTMKNLAMLRFPNSDGFDGQDDLTAVK